MIKNIADIISTHDLEKIQRDLRNIALSPKNADDAQAQTKTSEQKKALLLAQDFITQKGKPADNWRTSTACFEALTDWFEQATQIENHLQLSMISWYCQLEQMLTHSINPNRIITLGSAYYAEPHKFIGFLYWLLENGTEQSFIIQSNILHLFFAYHAFEMTTLENSYALLANLSNRVNLFLLILKNCSCNMRGFINNEQEDGTYYSYNLLGTFFTHHTLLREYTIRETANLYLESTYLNSAEQLFYLFGWELLKKLNYTDRVNQSIFHKLLQSEMKTKILSEFPTIILQGQLPTLFANSIFLIIRESYHPDELFAITQREPFFIHAAGPNLHTAPLESQLNSIINALCSNSKYHTLHHLPFLVTLTTKLEGGYSAALFGTNWNTREINLILKTIVDIILPHGNTIYDEAIRPILHIIRRLTPFFIEEITSLAHNIDTAILNFNYGEINYETLTHTWGSQLSTCNLIFSLLPNLPDASSYPRTIYQLHTRVLQKKCALCIVNEEAFPLENMLSTINPDAAIQKRILQETLVDPLSQAALIETILNYTTPAFSSTSLVFEHFGTTISVLFHAFTTQNEALSRLLLSKKIATDEHLFGIIETTLSNNQINQFNLAWSHLEFDETNQVAITQLLLQCIRNESIHSETREICFTKIFTFLQTLGESILTRDTLTGLFAETIKYSHVTYTKILCNLNGANQLSPRDIKTALFDTAIQWETWDIIAFLCGLSGDITVKPTLIKANNIDLYFNIIKKYKEYYEKDIAPTNAFLYTNDNNETPLHFAANYCTFDKFKKIFHELRKTFAAEPEKIAALLHATTKSNQIVECTTDHRAKESINTFLIERRAEYQEQEEDDTSTTYDEEEDEEEGTTGRRRSREESDSDEINDLFRRAPS